MITGKPFSDLKPGDFVADEFDLVDLRQRFGIVSSFQWRWDRDAQPPAKHIPFPFPLKQLRVLGSQDDGSLVCGYNYDSRLSGIVVLCEYVVGPDGRD